MESMCIKRSLSLLRLKKESILFLVLEDRSPIGQLPNEILLKLFSCYLNPLDLLTSCIRVNKQWKKFIEDQIIWKVVNPINWSRGLSFILFNSNIIVCFFSSGQWNSNIPIEEKKNSDEENWAFMKENETRFLNGFVKYFLPNYGGSIENLILYGSLTINDNLVKFIR